VPRGQEKIHHHWPYSKGLALAADNGLTGCVDAQDIWRFRPEITEAFNFSNGLARFQTDDLYGYLDNTGKIGTANQ
jgi:hypothetical protein